MGGWEPRDSSWSSRNQLGVMQVFGVGERGQDRE